jgi:hypothetical protein
MFSKVFCLAAIAFVAFGEDTTTTETAVDTSVFTVTGGDDTNWCAVRFYGLINIGFPIDVCFASEKNFAASGYWLGSRVYECTDADVGTEAVYTPTIVDASLSSARACSATTDATGEPEELDDSTHYSCDQDDTVSYVNLELVIQLGETEGGQDTGTGCVGSATGTVIPLPIATGLCILNYGLDGDGNVVGAYNVMTSTSSTATYETHGDPTCSGAALITALTVEVDDDENTCVWFSYVADLAGSSGNVYVGWPEDSDDASKLGAASLFGFVLVAMAAMF